MAAGGQRRPMIGRRDELGRLRRLRPDDGPRIGLVGGEAGIGKTLLLTTLAARLADDGMPQLRGYATPASAARPFDLLRSLVGAAVAGWDDVPPALAGRRAAVVRLIGPVAPHLRSDQQPAPDELAWVGSELVAHLSQQPTALLVDDLHHADAESLDVLDRLLAGTAPVLLVAAYRPSALDGAGPARDWLTRIERRQPVEHLRLAPLDLAETRALLAERGGPPPDEPVVRRLRERTGGNPFFLVELLGANAGRPLRDLADGALPATVSVLLDDQLCCLAPGPRRTLDRLAVLGQRVTIDELLAVSDGDEATVLDDVRQLIDAGLVVEDRPDELAFRHALVQEAALARVLTRERRLVHQRALDWVLATSGDDSLVVHHAAAAGRDELVVDAARRAAPRALDEGSPRRALALAEGGLQHEPSDPVLLCAAGHASWQLGMRHEARLHADALLAQAELAGDAGAEAAALGLLIRLNWEAGQEGTRRQLADRLDRLVARLPDDGVRAQALADLAQTAMLTDRSEQAVELADDALALASRLGAARVVVQARVERASALVNRDPDDLAACAELLDAIDAAGRLGDVLTLVRAANNVVHMSSCLTIEQEDELLQRGIAAGGRLADPGALDLIAGPMRLRRPLRQGDQDEIRRQLAVLRGRPDRAVHKLTDWLAVEVGTPHQVREVAHRLLADDDLHGVVLAAAASVLLGDTTLADTARPGLAAAAADPRPSAPPWHAVEATPLALVLLIDDGWDRAVVDRCIEVLAAERAALPCTHAYLRALAAERAGRPDGALAHLDEAARLAAREPAVTRAEIAHLRARCLAAVGDRAAADRHATAAVDELARWPGHRRRRMERQAAALAADRRSGGAAPGGPGGVLTRRELEVAALVADGLSNGEIAQRLYISRKTASVHVSNILAKLALTNRTEIATWVVRRSAAATGG